MRTPIRILRTFAHDARGSVTVEFLAVTPVLLAALVFSFEFGRALWAYDVMARDIRAAARYLQRAPSSYTSQAQAVAETGSPTGTTKHFPWSQYTGSFSFTVAKTFTSSSFNQSGSVLRVSASLPLTLPLLDVLGIDTAYTLVVFDEVRHVGE